MRKIVSELLKNKNIERNLKEYYGKFMEINNTYAHIRFAMNYYTYYVMISEDNGILQSGYKVFMDTVNHIVQKISSGTHENFDCDISELEKIRAQMIEQVADITSYIDMYNIYEYALNRVEYRFKEDELPTGYSDEAYTRKLMQFILEDEDNMLINAKIQNVVEQLPLRMTKAKFYEMITNGLSIYKGGPKESLDDFLYMVKTVSMLNQTDTMAMNYPYLSEVFLEFKNVCFKTLTVQQYQEIREKAEDIARYIDGEMNQCMTVQEIINDLLLLLYTENHKKEDKLINVCEEIIKETGLLSNGKFSHKTVKEIENMFVALEGQQETLYPQISAYDITDYIKENYLSEICQLGLEQPYKIVFKLPKINSDSIFADLEKEADQSVAEENIVSEETDKLIFQYGQLFANHDRLVNRAVMSAALSELPVFFDNISELQDFIYHSLSLCTDKSEKIACIEILEEIMAG